ncbi:MAG: ISNCY family transposase [Nitrospira sp.]|nr:ISNCY family transposase [Nitrospira sp.]MDH4250604.1 ISNCY family transposase [Nitrospira sp.]MDH4343973.1 ISNCY family transposase [Nitrospira sp.]MDH5336568.1 ISNCY family transposase [Nitrospira sp.]
MVGEDRVTMSGKELRRVHVIRQVLEHRLTQKEASTLLGVTDRQIRRLTRRVEQEGDHGLVHRARGRPSNRRISEGRKTTILQLYETRYGDFGPTLASEQLTERHRLPLSAETLRRWLRARGIEHFSRRKRPHRAWRARKAHVGELVQVDGSHHDWFEGRGPRCVLLAYIDDASSRVFARFYTHEGTIPAMDSFQRYVRRYGLPLALYTDRHTTYQSPAAPTIEEQLAGVEPTSQFGRALHELGVERLFKTFQDRLVKELRLAKIATLAAANHFLDDYLSRYNRRFTVPPAQPTDLHRPCPARSGLDRILCIKTSRVLRRDWTVAHNGHLYQVQTNVRARQVVMEDRLDGTLCLTHRGRVLDYHLIPERPVPPAKPRTVVSRRRPVKPPRTHPWYKRVLPPRELLAAAGRT